MSRENVEIVREFFEGLREGKPTALHLLDPDIEWHVEDTLPDAAVWHGHAGVEAFFAGLREVWERLCFEADRYVEVGDAVLVEARQIGYGRSSDVPVEQPLYPVFGMRGGRAVRIDVYFARDRALEAVGLRE